MNKAKEKRKICGDLRVTFLVSEAQQIRHRVIGIYDLRYVRLFVFLRIY